MNRNWPPPFFAVRITRVSASTYVCDHVPWYAAGRERKGSRRSSETVKQSKDTSQDDGPAAVTSTFSSPRSSPAHVWIRCRYCALGAAVSTSCVTRPRNGPSSFVCVRLARCGAHIAKNQIVTLPGGPR